MSDINDPNFFSDENLDSIAQPVQPWELKGDGSFADGPNEGSNLDEAELADAKGKTISRDEGREPESEGDSAEADDLTEDDLEPSGDSDDDDFDLDEDDEDDEPAGEPEGRYSAEGHKEAQAYANRLKAELDALKAAQQQAPQPESYDEPAGPVPNIQQDPWGAFEYATQYGEDAMASVIGSVQAEANQYAALAAQARAEGEEEHAAHYAGIAAEHTTAAARMQLEAQQVLAERQLAPVREREVVQNLSAASAWLRQSYGEEAQRYGAEIGAFVRDNMHLMQTGSAQEAAQLMEQGLIHARGKDMPNILARERKEYAEKLRRKRARARSAGGEGGPGRPAGQGYQPTPVEQINKQKHEGGLAAFLRM